MSGKPSLGSLSLKPTPSAAGIPEVDSPSPILIDMGSHILEGVSAEDMAGLAGPLAPSIVGIRLAQIVTRALAPRALLLPPLKTARQVGQKKQHTMPLSQWCLECWDAECRLIQRHH
jgi:hypothetical protein